MGWSDLLALVGAAAWLPQLWKFLQKPKVSILVGGQVEVGSTDLGPIFNPKIAFRAEKRDALVTGVRFVVQHERGQEAIFEATTLVEAGPQGEYTSGQRSFQQKFQEVVAIVLTPQAVAERKVQSRERECLQAHERLGEPLGLTIARLRNTAPDWVDQVLRSPALQDLRDFLSRRFFWQAGNYTARCEATVDGQAHPVVAHFRFMLTAVSMQLLTDNAAILERNLRKLLQAPNPNESVKQDPVNWVYPMVQRS